MRIISLRIKNLNSLNGNWFIDFSNQEYATNGIFALTGPTGAGKSTILDAICLALYGRTPRLKNINHSSNEIMSRQVGECFAEIVFESKSGRYRCHWEHHRANKKPNGKLQDPKHEIVEDATGNVIENKRSEVINVVEEQTGLDFDRFTRSVLLAQGGFDSFLKAKTEDKSKILEQITGTAIYTEISIHVYNIHKEEKDKLELLKAEIEGVNILTQKEVKEIESQIKKITQEEIILKKQLEQINLEVQWLEQINKYKNEIKEIIAKETKNNLALEKFKPNLLKLELANKAKKFSTKFEKIQLLRNQDKEDQHKSKKLESNLPKLEKAVTSALNILETTKSKLKAKKEEQKKLNPIIKEVRKLDQQIDVKDDEYNKLEQQIKDISANIKKLQTNLKNDNSDKDKKNKEITKVKDYLKSNASDEWLIENLAAIKEQLKTLVNQSKEISDLDNKTTELKDDLDNANNTLTETEELIKQNNTKISATNEQLKSKEDKLNNLLDGKKLADYRKDKDFLLKESSYIEKINNLEAIRKTLEDGKECPVCGSKDHPFAKGNIPSKTDVDKKIEMLTNLIAKLEKLEVEITKFKDSINQDTSKLRANKVLKDSTAKEIDKIKKQINENSQKKDSLKENLSQLKAEIIGSLEPLGIKQINDKLLDKLNNSLKKWQEQVKLKQSIANEISTIDKKILENDTKLKSNSESLEDKETELENLRQVYNQMVDNRNKIFGDKDTDEVEQKIIEEIEIVDEIVKENTEQHNNAKQVLSNTNIEIKNLKTQITTRQKDISDQLKLFLEQVRKVGFKTEEEYVDARLPENEHEKLEKQANQLNKTKIELAAENKSINTKLAAEIAKEVTTKTLEQVHKEKLGINEKIEANNVSKGELSNQLSTNKENQEKIKTKQENIKLQKLEVKKWSKLNQLIGKADGTRFRNFAQGLTFELMIKHANLQLAKMSDRYILIRDDKQPIELNVQDNYQAGEIRTIKNLSGGESFIVSLALALGLSKMTSRKVQVDSLFLDEGFGTLDEEALGTALDTLSTLHQEGKLIGVVSHIPALKERISTQISVIPITGGRSILKGPGCKNLS